METQNWRDAAACRDEDPELHFPVGHSGPALRQLAEAKAVCHRCPVRQECLDWAQENGQNTGVWGGMSEDERREQRRPNLAPVPTRPPAQHQPVTPEVRAEVLRRTADRQSLKVIEQEMGISRDKARRIRVEAVA